MHLTVMEIQCKGHPYMMAPNIIKLYVMAFLYKLGQFSTESNLLRQSNGFPE